MLIGSGIVVVDGAVSGSFCILFCFCHFNNKILCSFVSSLVDGGAIFFQPKDDTRMEAVILLIIIINIILAIMLFHNVSNVVHRFLLRHHGRVRCSKHIE